MQGGVMRLAAAPVYWDTLAIMFSPSTLDETIRINEKKKTNICMTEMEGGKIWWIGVKNPGGKVIM